MAAAASAEPPPAPDVTDLVPAAPASKPVSVEAVVPSDRPSGVDTWPKGRPLDAEHGEAKLEDAKPVAARAQSMFALGNKRTRMIAIAAGAAVLLIVVVIVATRGGGSSSKEDDRPKAAEGSGTTEIDRHLAQAETRIGEGKLVGPGGDTALDHLLEAKRLAPSNQQVQGRLRALADKLEKLGDDAATAGDLAEAATQFQAALAFEPERASARDKLQQVEQRARGK